MVNRLYFADQADKTAELVRLDELIIGWTGKPRAAKALKLAVARRRKVSGWVVGA